MRVSPLPGIAKVCRGAIGSPFPIQFPKRGVARLAYERAGRICRHSDTSEMVAMQVVYRASGAGSHPHHHALPAEEVVLVTEAVPKACSSVVMLSKWSVAVTRKV